MTSALDQQGINYQLQNNGTALAVQSNETAQARVALAGAGCSAATHPDLSLFEKQNLGESNFQQQVNYQRAHAGTARGDDRQRPGSVAERRSSSCCPTPRAQLFAESQTTASAAVLLSGTSSLDPGSVRGIAQLVASSVPGLQLSKVTITDGTGQLLWPARAPKAAGRRRPASRPPRQRYDQSMARQSRRDARADARPRQGAGAGRTPNMNVNQTTQETLTYGKAGVPLQQSKDIETLAGNGSGGGAPRAPPTSPPPPRRAPAASPTTSTKSPTPRSASTRPSPIPRSRPGKSKASTSRCCSTSSVPAASLPAIREAITNAAGHPAQARRHDLDRAGGIRQAGRRQRRARTGGIIGYAKYALIGLASLRLPVLHHALAAPPRAGARSTTSRRGCASWRCPCASQSWSAKPRPPSRGAGRSAPACQRHGMAGGDGDHVRRQVEQLAESNPDRVAQQLRTWMQEG